MNEKDLSVPVQSLRKEKRREPANFKQLVAAIVGIIAVVWGVAYFAEVAAEWMVAPIGFTGVLLFVLCGMVFADGL